MSLHKVKVKGLRLPRAEVNWPIRTKGTRNPPGWLSPNYPEMTCCFLNMDQTYARQVIPPLGTERGMERRLLQVMVSQRWTRNQAQKSPSAFSAFPFPSLLVTR